MPRTAAQRRLRSTADSGRLSWVPWRPTLPAILDVVRKGLSYRDLARFESESGLSRSEILAVLRTPVRTLARRRKSGRFTPDESERLVRLILLYQKALELMGGDRQAATRWLATPKPALGGATPIEMARTEFGAREVENLIGRLEHGVIT